MKIGWLVRLVTVPSPPGPLGQQMAWTFAKRNVNENVLQS